MQVAQFIFSCALPASRERDEKTQQCQDAHILYRALGKVLELQIECTKQNQRNATFDLDLFSSLDPHKMNREPLTDCSELSLPQNTGENMYFTGFFCK